MWQPKKYIAKMIESYERLFQLKPKYVSSPLEKGDHPELDDSPLLDAPEISTYMSLIGQLQWLITLGRFDIMQATVSLSSFHSLPRQGHLERAKRVFGYVAKFHDAVIRVRPGTPNFIDIDEVHPDYEWAHSVCGNQHKEFPMNMPDPLGFLVCIIIFLMLTFTLIW
jgi:hypothetical protein